MTQVKKRWLANHIATLSGIVVGIMQAWLLIDWSNFDIKKEWPKLLFSAVAVIAGYKTTFKVK